ESRCTLYCSISSPRLPIDSLPRPASFWHTPGTDRPGGHVPFALGSSVPGSGDPSASAPVPAAREGQTAQRAATGPPAEDRPLPEAGRPPRAGVLPAVEQPPPLTMPSPGPQIAPASAGGLPLLRARSLAGPGPEGTFPPASPPANPASDRPLRREGRLSPPKPPEPASARALPASPRAKKRSDPERSPPLSPFPSRFPSRRAAISVLPAAPDPDVFP